MSRSLKIIGLVSASALIALVAGTAAQADTREPAQITVSAKTVDFHDSVQVKAFYAKLNAMADMVCVHQVNAPLLSQIDDIQQSKNAAPMLALGGSED
jgi:UrcA family protein